jgi:phospholipid/cholesterol/gamma-HCH transport system substrate-binding protein
VSRRAVRLLAALVGLCALAGALSGCGVSTSDLPLPTQSVGAPTYRLTALFADALNLPDGAHVKLNGDDIGRVQSITLHDFTARVAMDVRTDVPLPAGTTAELRQATPLGEIFVAMRPPAHPAPGPALHDGDVLGLPRTQTGVSIEDLLSSFSMFINGGGLSQTQTIAHELNNAFNGHTAQAVHLMGQSSDLLATLNANTGNIDKALDATRDLTDTLNRREDSVNRAFADLTPAIRLFADQTDNFDRALRSAARTGDHGTRFLDRARPDTEAVLHDLRPISRGFTETRPFFKSSLNDLVGFGYMLYQHTDGDAVAAGGSADLSALFALPSSTSGLNTPLATMFLGGEQEVAQDLERHYSTFGGSRPNIGGTR